MKNKKLSWILLPAVLAIWGMIGWKIYAAVNGEEETFTGEPAQAELPTDTSVVPDEYTLLLDYRDPFFEKKPQPKQNTAGVKKAEPVPVKNSAPVITQWPSVSYGGLVRQTQSGKTVGFLIVNGASHFVNAGDVAGELTVTKMWSDSIEVRFGKESRRIRK